jgi:hypothetical protein
MREEVRKLYRFSELSAEAQEKALQEYETGEFAWSDEWRNTLEKFAEIFNVKIKDFSVNPWGNSYINMECNANNSEELKGIRLYKYIMTSSFIFDILFPRKFITLKKYEKDTDLYKMPFYKDHTFTNYKGEKFVSLHSKTIRSSDAHLTGYSGDYSICKPIYEFLKNPKASISYSDLMQECAESWRIDWEKDMEWQESDEYKKEEIEANEVEFLENGERV